MAMQSKPQRGKGIKNSPKAGQGESKNMLEPSHYKLEQKAKNMEHGMRQKGYYTTPIKTKHGMTWTT